MRSKLPSVILMVLCSMAAMQISAQTRYLDSIFASYTVTTVTYSTVYNLQMDIYQPSGDNLNARPVVLLAHEGTFITGSRTSDQTVVRLCEDLAHKGYVAISMDYRLSDQAAEMLGNADSAATEVFQAVGDGKAAVRYLHEYADSFALDTNNIFIGGNDAGAILFLHYAYIDSLSQLNADSIFPAIVANTGGLAGNSGNPGYSMNFKGVINLAGGLNQAAWIGYCSKPIVSAQGDNDDVVPYTCGEPDVSGFVVPIQLCGLGSMQYYITSNTPYYESLIFPGDGHDPWDTYVPIYDQVDTLITGFLYKEVTNAVPDTCTGFPAGIRSVSYTADISVYPNPATNVLNIQSSQYITDVSLTDESGRVISEVADVQSIRCQLNTTALSPGIYFVRISNGQGQVAVVRKVIIE